MVESAQGVQHGCNIGPFCYGAGSLEILKEFRANSTMPGARTVSFMDDIMIILPPELSLDVAAIEKSYGMAVGTPRGKRYLVESKEIAGPSSRWSRARTSDGREAYNNG